MGYSYETVFRIVNSVLKFYLSKLDTEKKPKGDKFRDNDLTDSYEDAQSIKACKDTMRSHIYYIFYPDFCELVFPYIEGNNSWKKIRTPLLTHGKVEKNGTSRRHPMYNNVLPGNLETRVSNFLINTLSHFEKLVDLQTRLKIINASIDNPEKGTFTLWMGEWKKKRTKDSYPISREDSEITIEKIGEIKKDTSQYIEEKKRTLEALVNSLHTAIEDTDEDNLSDMLDIISVVGSKYSKFASSIIKADSSNILLALSALLTFSIFDSYEDYTETREQVLKIITDKFPSLLFSVLREDLANAADEIKENESQINGCLDSELPIFMETPENYENSIDGIVELAKERNCVVVLGSGGVGKSHLLVRLMQENKKAHEQLFLYVSLSKDGKVDEPFSLERLIDRRYKAEGLLECIKADSLNNKFILLLDGYNEISEEKQRELLDDDIVKRHSVIIASRKADDILSDFEQVNITELSDEVFINAIKKADIPDNYEGIPRTPLFLMLILSSAKITDKLERHYAKFLEKNGINPQSVEAILLRFLYSELNKAINIPSTSQNHNKYSSITVFFVCSYIAYKMDNLYAVDEDWLNDAIEDLFPINSKNQNCLTLYELFKSVTPCTTSYEDNWFMQKDFAINAILNNGILMHKNQDTYSFGHQIIQEFLAQFFVWVIVNYEVNDEESLLYPNRISISNCSTIFSLYTFDTLYKFRNMISQSPDYLDKRIGLLRSIWNESLMNEAFSYTGLDLSATDDETVRSDLFFHSETELFANVGKIGAKNIDFNFIFDRANMTGTAILNMDLIGANSLTIRSLTDDGLKRSFDNNMPKTNWCIPYSMLIMPLITPSPSYMPIYTDITFPPANSGILIRGIDTFFSLHKNYLIKWFPSHSLAELFLPLSFKVVDGFQGYSRNESSDDIYNMDDAGFIHTERAIFLYGENTENAVLCLGFDMSIRLYKEYNNIGGYIFFFSRELMIMMTKVDGDVLVHFLDSDYEIIKSEPLCLDLTNESVTQCVWSKTNDDFITVGFSSGMFILLFISNGMITKKVSNAYHTSAISAISMNKSIAAIGDTSGKISVWSITADRHLNLITSLQYLPFVDHTKEIYSNLSYSPLESNLYAECLKMEKNDKRQKLLQDYIEKETKSSHSYSSNFIIRNRELLAVNASCSKSVAVPNGVTAINSYSFCPESHYNLVENVYLPPSVQYIHDMAFKGCKHLHSINMPDALSYLGAGAFYDCSSLWHAFIPDTITEIKDRLFSGCITLHKVKLSPNTVSIGDSSFMQCYALEEIELPPSVTFIDCYAFYCCESIETVSLPFAISFIGYHAFSGCRNLETVYFYCQISQLDLYIFGACDNLKTIYISNYVSCVNIGFKIIDLDDRLDTWSFTVPDTKNTIVEIVRMKN